jgi:hypothetical protein
MKIKTLDLHETKHADVEETVARFLNWVEVPCRIITGNSGRMKNIVEKMVDKYGYSCYNESAFNFGSFIIVDQKINDFE